VFLYTFPQNQASGTPLWGMTCGPWPDQQDPSFDSPSSLHQSGNPCTLPPWHKTLCINTLAICQWVS